ncbi:hypothetical protein LEP1GSC185_3202 [Leptospira licerasiae serovar Varillal str. VAR 010]|nr:hypothetical protein LEP1GSC185_3202 [Leptospira licerasiae serovar Varillal str. VAR 010]
MSFSLKVLFVWALFFILLCRGILNSIFRFCSLPQTNR